MRTFLLTIVAIVLVVWLATSALFQVDRAEFVYLTQFGKKVAAYDGKLDAGLHVKWPWPIQSVQRLDNRLQFFDLREVELLTRDKGGGTVDKNLMISAYVCWRIANKTGPDDEGGVDRFVRTIGTPDRARAILEQRVLSKLGAEVGKMTMEDLINVSEPGKIEKTMDDLRRRLLASNGTEAGLKQLAREGYGIDLVDVRLRRFNHPASVRSDIFARITSERDQLKAKYESEGAREEANILSQAELDTRAIRTQAENEAKLKREKAAVQADAIRNQAQSKDPEFYAFLQKLEAYKNILNAGKDVLLLSSKNELFDMLLKPPSMNGKPVPKLPSEREVLPVAPLPAPAKPQAGLEKAGGA